MYTTRFKTKKAKSRNKIERWTLRFIYTFDFRGLFCIKLVSFTEYNYFYNYENVLG